MDKVRNALQFRSNKPPAFLKLRSSTWFISWTVCIAVFTDVFLYGVIVPVIPFALRDRAHVPQDQVQHWVSVLLAIYGAALLVGSPICGTIADYTNSRRTPLLVGLLVLTGSTIMLCVGTSISVLVVGRLFQGLSASAVWTVALALLADTAGEEIGKFMGYVAMSYSMGILVAPLLGGVVYQRSGYYAVFGMTFGVISLDILLRLLLIEKKIAAKWLTENSSGEQTHDTVNVPVQDNEGNVVENNSTPSGSVAERPKPKTKLPPMLILLKSRRIQAAFWGNLVGATVMSAFDATLPLYVNQIFGWDSLGGGLIFLAPIIPSFAGPIIGHFTDKYGPRWIAATGLIMALPFWVLLRFVDHDGIRQVVLLSALLVFIGAAMALVLTSLMSEFSKVCDAKERQQPGLFGPRGGYGQSYGIFNVAWSAGTLLGPFWSAGVKSAAGWKTMTWTLGLLCAVSSIPIILFSGGMITRRKQGVQTNGNNTELDDIE